MWILHDMRYNRSRPAPAELYLRSSPHYFTNMNSQGVGQIYDQGSRLKRGKRIYISPRLPIQIQEPYKPTQSQLKHRNAWKLAFKGDLAEFDLSQPWKKKRCSLKWLFVPYLILFQKLLETVTNDSD